jgi:O-antigen ligase
MNTMTTNETSHSRLVALVRYLPWLLPLLLIFSRSLADITVLIVGLTYVFRSYKSNDWGWTKHVWFKLNVLFWLFLLLINTPLSINPSESLLYAIFYIRWPLFAAALAYWLLNDKVRQQHFLIALVLTSLFVMFDTSLQYVTGHDLFGHTKASPTRLTGPYNRPIPGIMMLRVLFIGLLMAVIMPQLSSAIRRIVFTLTMLGIGMVFIFITGERMALMLFLTGSIVVLIGLSFAQKEHQAKMILGFIALLSVFISIILLNPDTAERSVYSIVNKLTHFVDSDYGHVFRAAIAAWQEYPLLGSGYHTYKTICNEMGLLAQWGIQCSHPHNLYLQIAAETGFVGLVLFGIMVTSIYFTALYRHIQNKDWFTFSISFVVLSVCFWPLIGGISILNNSVAALVWLGVGWVLSIAKSPTNAISHN